MGKPTGFLEIERRDRGYAAAGRAAEELRKEFVHPLPARRGRAAGGALHGLRHSVLPPGLPGQQPDPRLEQPGLSRPVADRAREPALDQQLPGVHRPHLPRALRGELHAEHHRHPGDHQDRSNARSSTAAGKRAGSSRSAGRAATGKRVAVVGSGPAGLACAQQLARAGHARDRVREDRPHRRPAPLRHSRLQDGEAPDRPAHRARWKPKA